MSSTILTMVLLMPMHFGIISPGQAQRVAELLENGIYAEEARGDLTAAIELYSKVAAASEAERPVVAQALLRLGMCYLKRGRFDAARNAFDKLAKQYSEQKAIVEQIPSMTIQLTLPAARARQVGLFLTRVLRHDPAAAGIQLDAGGWAAIDALLLGAATRGFPIGRDEFDEVVRTSDKHRFALSEDGAHVRANYGHSVPVDMRSDPVKGTGSESEEDARGQAR
jgi:tetratricopeptide (TPR) repeat protein